MHLSLCPTCRPRRRAAFTLVELLVVIGIISVLVGILLPTLGRAREQANTVKCMANLRQVVTATLMYCNANKGWIPATSQAGRLVPHDWIYWDNARSLDQSPIAPYLGRTGTKLPTNLLTCPSDDTSVRVRQNITSGVPNPYRFSYVQLNRLGCNLNPNGTTVPPIERATKLNQVRDPSGKAFYFEEEMSTMDDGNGSPDFPGPTNLLAIRHDRRLRADPTASGTYTTLPEPNRRGNVAFCDGSVRALTRKEFHRPQVCCPKWPAVKPTDGFTG